MVAPKAPPRAGCWAGLSVASWGRSSVDCSAQRWAGSTALQSVDRWAGWWVARTAEKTDFSKAGLWAANLAETMVATTVPPMVVLKAVMSAALKVERTAKNLVGEKAVLWVLLSADGTAAMSGASWVEKKAQM